MRAPVSILFEDNHLLVVQKPVGLPTMGAAAGEPSLVQLLKEFIKHRDQKPGNVYLGVVSRLDSPVSGVTVFAKTSKGAARLSEQFRQREVAKLYWALISPPPSCRAAQLEHWLRKDERQQKMHVTRAGGEDAQLARLTYRTLATREQVALVEVQLETGRKHQIRVQLTAAGSPVLGDRKYGSRDAFPAGIALHARQLTIQHPTRREPLTFTAPVPKSWQRYLPENLAE